MSLFDSDYFLESMLSLRPGARIKRLGGIRIERHDVAPLQVGPVGRSGNTALYDCPCGCGLWTSTPDKVCKCCGKSSPATHWESFSDTCPECSG